MKKPEVLKRAGVSHVTLHRYMKHHPKLSFQDENSLKGHPFPSPTHKEGRELVWNDDEVVKWLADNKEFVGSNAKSGVRITMPYLDLRIAMRDAEIPELDQAPSSDVAGGDKNTDLKDLREFDEMTLFKLLEFDGEDYSLEFKTVDDAVAFKLKYTLSNDQRKALAQ